MSTFLTRLETVEAVFLDVDGVLTDGSILVTEEGHQLRKMNIKDGYALQWAVKQGVHICIISGGKSNGVVTRLNGLGITDVFTGVADKLACFYAYVQEKQIKPENCLYVGDDIPDLPVMRACGLKASPADAANDVLPLVDYVSRFAGGKGCVRDILEKLLKVKNLWHHPNGHYW